MIDSNLQPLSVKLEFSYDAELFDGDPTDAYEIARLEKEALEDALEGAVLSVLGDFRSFKVSIIPD